MKYIFRNYMLKDFDYMFQCEYKLKVVVTLSNLSSFDLDVPVTVIQTAKNIEVCRCSLFIVSLALTGRHNYRVYSLSTTSVWEVGDLIPGRVIPKTL